MLLGTDKTLYSLGYHEKVLNSLAAHNIKYNVFSNISSEPEIGIIEEGRAAAVACSADCIIALGGGSVLDAVKIIAVGAKKPGRSSR